MKQKTFFFLILLVCLSALVMYGCGSDEEDPDKPTVEPTTPEETEITTEKLLGTWNILTINDQSTDTFIGEVLNGDEPDLEDRPKTDVSNFSAVFEENDSWSLNLELEMSDFPEDPNKDDPDNAAKIELAGTWAGGYSIAGDTLTLTINDPDVSISTKPEGLFETLFETSEMEAQQELIEKFASQVLLPFAITIATLKEDKLDLRSIISPTSQMILDKQ